MRTRSSSVLLCLSVAAALVAGCRKGPSTAPPAPAVIVLVTLDTVRADHLGCYGYPRDTTPFIDWIAAHGVRFDRAISQMATTVPSHASLFTSRYPLQHGVRSNGEVLDDSFLTMAEFLRAAGYATAAFVGTSQHFGPGHLNQGFDVFDEPDIARGAYRPADQTVQRAIAWLDGRRPADRLFLWVHLFDAHRPYDPRHRYPAGTGAESERMRKFWIESQRVDDEYLRRRHVDVAEQMNAYDGELKFLDAAVEQLFHAVQNRLGDRPALWILVADHGEGLGNHRWLEHGKMIYNEQVRVPLIFYFSSGASAGLSTDRVTEVVDVFPTVAALVGAAGTATGATFEGRSLLPILRGDGEALAAKYGFSERREFAPRRGRKTGADANYEAGEKFSLQDGRYKYILHTAGRDEFFDLAADPHELDNRIDAPSADRDRLRAALAAEIARLERGPRRTAPAVDQKTLDRLRALGYEP